MNEDIRYASNLIEEILTRRSFYLPIRNPLKKEMEMAPKNLARVGVLKEFTLDSYFWHHRKYPADDYVGYTYSLMKDLTSGVWKGEEGWESCLDVYRDELTSYLESKGRTEDEVVKCFGELDYTIFGTDGDMELGKIFRESLFRRDRKELKMVYDTISSVIENRLVQEWDIYVITEEKPNYKLSDMKPATAEEVEWLTGNMPHHADLLETLVVGLTITKERPKDVVPKTLFDLVMENQDVTMQELKNHGFSENEFESLNQVFLHRIGYYLMEKPGAGIREALKRNLENRGKPRYRAVDTLLN